VRCVSLYVDFLTSGKLDLTFLKVKSTGSTFVAPAVENFHSNLAL